MIRAFIISSLIRVLTILCRPRGQQEARSDPQRFGEPLALVSTVGERPEIMSW